MLNFASSPVWGRWWKSEVVMPWFPPTSTFSTCSGRTSCSLIKRSISPIAGWVKEPDGCGLIETPGFCSVHGFPSRPAMAPGS